MTRAHFTKQDVAEVIAEATPVLRTRPGDRRSDAVASTAVAAPIDLVRDQPTWRTLADIDDTPPRPLILGMLEPDGPTLLYGAPGVGKGTTGAWLIVELLRLGLRPAVYDAERRPKEWARRVSGLGGDRSRVVYLEPPDLGPRFAGRPLWEMEPALRAIVEAAGVDLLLVDSILPAVGMGEEHLRSDAQVPYLFVAALDALGIPSVSFGHPPKGQPEGEPFGSMAWVAAPRLTWLGTRAEGEGHQIRWRPRKRNERGGIPGRLLTVHYGDDGRPCEVEPSDDESSTGEWLEAALAGATDDVSARSVADLADEQLEQSDEHVTEDLRTRTKERLSRSLRRLAEQGVVVRVGGAGRGARWRLKRT